MLRANRRTSLPKYVRASPVGLLSALIAAITLAVCAPAFGAHTGRPATVLLGDSAVEPQLDALAAGRLEAFRLRAHASGVVGSLRLYIDARSTATTFLVGLYRDAHRRPGALLARSSIVSARKGVWNTVSLPPSALVAGRPYWLTVLGEGGELRYRARRHGRCLSNTSVRANLSALPSAWSAGIARHAHCPISAYAIASSTSSREHSLTGNGALPAIPGSRSGSRRLGSPLGPLLPLTPPPKGKTPSQPPPPPKETPPPPPPGPQYPQCTQTLSQGSSVANTVSAAPSGSVICLNSGEYGNLTLNSTHTADVTLQAAPQAHVTGGSVVLGGSHIVVRGLWLKGEVALAAGASFMTIDRNDISNAGGRGGEGIVFETSDCTRPNAPTWGGCEAQPPVTDVTITANHIHDVGEGGSEDAIHLDNWRRVTISGNEFDHILESGNHTDCVQSVYGGEQLTFTHNYEHDNDCQGFFIKDGDATNVSFTDNLFVRDQIGSYANFAQVWNVKGLAIQHNTIWDSKGFVLVANEASFTPTATIDHNVIDILKVDQSVGAPFSITEGNDIFGELPTNMSLGSGDSVIANPPFANTAADDYRLAANPNGIGVDWTPAEQHYGPAG